MKLIVFEPDQKFPVITPNEMKLPSLMMEGYMEGKYTKITNNYSTLNNNEINSHITAFQHYSYI